MSMKNVSTIFGIVVFLGGIIFGYGQLTKTVAIAEDSVKSVEKKVDKYDEAVKRELDKFESEAKDQERRLDATERFIGIQSTYNARLLQVLEK